MSADIPTPDVAHAAPGMSRLRQRLTAAVRLAPGPRVFGYPAPLLVALVWMFVGTLAYARHYVQDPSRELDASVLPEYLVWLMCYLPWIALSPIVFRLEHRFPLGQPGRARHLAILVGLSVPVAFVASAMTLVFVFTVQRLFRLPLDLPLPIWAARELLGHEFLYWSSVGASWMLRTLLAAREHERRTARLLLEKAQLEASLRQAELDALRMRLNPHFLFNSLQNISVLTQHDPETGSRMLTRLGDLLRVSLGRDGGGETTLAAEVALTKTYLAIEQMRFGDRLSSRVDLDPRTEEALVPTFLLQPLVENAIRHGLRGSRDGGLIAIRSRLDDGALVLTVTDNGAGPPAEPLSEHGMGIGLGATCERLARMYPGRHTFSMCAAARGGTEVRITLPLRVEAATEAPGDAHAATADR